MYIKLYIIYYKSNYTKCLIIIYHKSTNNIMDIIKFVGILQTDLSGCYFGPHIAKIFAVLL
jgi:hypothetical protein